MENFRDYADARLRDLEGQIDRRIETQQRELRDVEKNLKLLLDAQADKMEAALHAAQRETELTMRASEKAIEKQEKENKEWRDQANEWRAQSADRERSQQEQTAILTSSFLPREVADSKFAQINNKFEALRDRDSDMLPREVFDRTVAEWSTWRAATSATLAKLAGAKGEQTAQEERIRPWQLWLAGSIVTVFMTVVVIVVNVVTSGW